MSDNTEADAIIVANTDAIAALIAVLANRDVLQSYLFSEALDAIQDIREEKTGSREHHPAYKKAIEVFIAASQKRL